MYYFLHVDLIHCYPFSTFLEAADVAAQLIKQGHLVVLEIEECS